MGLGGVISNLLSLGAKLLPAVNASTLQAAPSSSKSALDNRNHKINAELEKLMGMLERIRATLFDAEQREIRDVSVQLWLKELKQVAFHAEDVLDEYHYEVLRAQVDASDASPPDSRKRKLVQVPDDMFDQIQQIRNKFAEIEKHRKALRLLEEDGPRRCCSELQITQTSHFIRDTLGIFGREREKTKLIKLLCSESHNDGVVSVVAILGPGGLGKTTLAQLAYNDQTIRKQFDKFGWICVSDNFDVERLTKESVESITGNGCSLTNLSALQTKVSEEIRGTKVLLVLDDVWNEKRSLWELFLTPFKSASFAKILVTARNETVAKIMKTDSTSYLGYLSEEHCWQLFEYHAFGGVNKSEGSNLVQIGKQIMKKCGMLPLAVKAIAALLRYEAKEESWRNILESELWESDASNEIFPPLQLSYVRLPTYLKPCFLYCSMFPKDYLYDVGELVQLWISQGYIQSKRKEDAEEIGWEYAKQLLHRSLFEWNGNFNRFKLHDMIHDLARLTSKNACCSIESGVVSELPDLSNELYHVRIVDPNHGKHIEPLSFGKFTALRTLIIMGADVEYRFTTFDLSITQKLRALSIEQCYSIKFKHISRVGNLKHLRYLSLGHLLSRSPGYICFLYNLQNLILRSCAFSKLPKSIKNLVSLEGLEMNDCTILESLPKSFCQLKALRKLILVDCFRLKELPSDMGKLINLHHLQIYCCGVSFLPPSCSKFAGIKTLRVTLKCETIGWLKDFVDLRGTLSLSGLKHVSNLSDVQCANLTRMHNLEYLRLKWDDVFDWDIDGNMFALIIKGGQNTFLENENDFAVIAGLEPHPNLRELRIDGYCGNTFPEWIGSHVVCPLLEKIAIFNCKNFTFLKFGILHKLKYLDISFCDSLQSIRAESLKSLVKLWINCCENLHLFVLNSEPSVEPAMHTNETSYQSSFLGLRNLTSLRSLKILMSPKLQLLDDELPCVGSCEVEVWDLPLFRKSFLQRGINYKKFYFDWCVVEVSDLS